ncbi:MAG: zinc ribbon domain-containing protein [Thermodesulfobacteriota bacterium]
MPIYEFYCSDCHVIYSFLARKTNTRKRPACPRCGRPKLERFMSAFSISKGRSEADDHPLPDLDEARLEKAMGMLAREAEGINEDDPRQSARLMKKLSEAAGLEMGPGMEEAMRRLEAGESPDDIEAEMGDVFDAEESFIPVSKKGGRRKTAPPAKDEALYEL